MNEATFSSFPTGTVLFLKGLRANNRRDWFNENKAAYEQDLEAPARAFCEVMRERLEALTGLSHDAKVYRIHRDLRFSKDKTPYNAHLHI